MSPDEVPGHFGKVWSPFPLVRISGGSMPPPWATPDPNPMPEVICSDALDWVLYGWDRLGIWWFEARVRFVERIARLLLPGVAR